MSFDEEPLVRHKTGRHVLPRVGECQSSVEFPLTEPDSIVPPTVPTVPNRIEADRPVLRPSRRLVLVAEGEHVEASTQPASFVPTWRDATDDEDMVDALQHDLEGDPQRNQSGRAEFEGQGDVHQGDVHHGGVAGRAQQDSGEPNHFDMAVADSDPDASAPPSPPPAENPRNSGSGSVTPLASPRRDLLGESDTESLCDGASTVSVDALAALDAVDLSVVFSKRAAVMKTFSKFLRGSY